MHCNIIIPCFNGGGLLNNNLPKLFDYINKNDNKFEIYVVNDGSKDNTLEILDKFKNKITILSYEKNLGKGGAVRYGILNCTKCDAILFMDCDFSTDLKAIDESLKEIKNGFDVVVGSRFLKESVLPIKRTLKRRVMSKCCNMLVNAMFHFKLKDTQCGFKVFKYEFGKSIAKLQKINDWSFDVEYLFVSKLNKKRIVEIPVMWIESNTSTVRVFKSSYIFLKSLLIIKKNKKNYYEKIQ